MYYADIKNVDVANGPGIRVSLFVSGCTHHCKDCFNPESWDFNYGKPFDEEAAGKMMALLEPSHVRGLSLLGGEPFAPENQAAVLAFVRQVREKFPLKDIWCWTGYLYEELAAGKIGEHSRYLLPQLDVLVDGPFIMEQKDITLRFRGSANQRVLNVQSSISSGEPVLMLGY